MMTEENAKYLIVLVDYGLFAGCIGQFIFGKLTTIFGLDLKC